jgi:hypothetical protein
MIWEDIGYLQYTAKMKSEGYNAWDYVGVNILVIPNLGALAANQYYCRALMVPLNDFLEEFNKKLKVHITQGIVNLSVYNAAAICLRLYLLQRKSKHHPVR